MNKKGPGRPDGASQGLFALCAGLRWPAFYQLARSVRRLPTDVKEKPHKRGKLKDRDGADFRRHPAATGAPPL